MILLQHILLTKNISQAPNDSHTLHAQTVNNYAKHNSVFKYLSLHTTGRANTNTLKELISSLERFAHVDP